MDDFLSGRTMPRTSKRCTKGIAPSRYGFPEARRGFSEQNTTPASAAGRSAVHSGARRENYSASQVQTVVENSIVSARVENHHKPRSAREVNETVNRSVLSVKEASNRSVISKTSKISTLNLQLNLIEEQKKLNEEKRELLLKEASIRERIIEQLDMEGVDLQYRNDSHLYQGPLLDNWVNGTVKRSVDLDYFGKGKRQTLHQHYLPSGEDAANNESTDNESIILESQSFSSKRSHKLNQNSIILDIAKQCAANVSTTNKLLARQKLKTLPHFSGELVDWPTFISAFNGSTKLYELTDEENLSRLERALKGKARETVRALLTSPVNVPKIIKMLQLTYGRPEWIILSLIDKVKKMPPIRDDELDFAINCSNALNNMITTIKNSNCTHYIFNPELMSLLVEKLTSSQKYSWGKFKHSFELIGQYVSLDEFGAWFEEEVNILATISNPVFKNTYQKSLKRDNIVAVHAHGLCQLCEGANHVLVNCHKFKAKPVSERRQIVRDKKLCFICLKSGHMVPRCTSRRLKCGEDNCMGKHHKLLHLPKDSSINVPNNDYRNDAPVEDTPNEKEEICAKQSAKNKTVLLKIAPVVVKSADKELRVFAFFDEGSSLSMIEADLARELRLQGPMVPICYKWTNGIVHSEEDSQIVSLSITAEKNSKPYNLKKLHTVEGLDLPRQFVDVEEICRRYPHLDAQTLSSIQHVKPQILIGEDNAGLIVSRQVIQPRLSDPIMSRTKLGWTIHGVVGGNNAEETQFHQANHVSLCCNYDAELHNLVKISFRLEAFGINDKPIYSLDDKRALEIMEGTLKKVGKHFEIGHLWKNSCEILPDSKTNALRRLECIERKMRKSPEFANQYCEKISDYVNKGYAVKLKPSEVLEGPKIWYLPHFGVWNVNKPGKLRLVFDAAAKSHGSSLNDFLLAGPNLVPSLIAVLWRFREKKVAVNGDIKEMFHQVIIRKEDRCAQQFLWRGTNYCSPPDVYQMNVMIFGAVSSPAIAQFVKNRNAEMHESAFPGIENAMKRQHYVDDYLESFNTEEEAIKAVKYVIYVHEQAGYEICKWVSNSKRVQASIPENLRAMDPNIFTIDVEKVERILGLAWSPKDDCFLFTINLKKIETELILCQRIPTKREVLRIIMSIFDPLGFLAPIMIKARILMQNIWRTDLNWDDTISEDLFTSWKSWFKQLQNLDSLKVHRYYFPELETVHEVVLHVFADASETAYSAVAYLRAEIRNGDVVTSFVFSKFRVAPIKQQTVPKLELQAAVLACRIAKTIVLELDYSIKEVHFWTDSMVVLSQIRSETMKFPTFVACRVGEIQETSVISNWHWVPSENNVADLATKSKSNAELNNDSMWFHGPEFLRMSDESWPKEPETYRSCNLQHGIATKEATIFVLPKIDRFSKYNRLIRATAWLFQFFKILKLPKRERLTQLILDFDSVQKATNLWIQKCQYDVFLEEILTLHSKRTLNRSNKLYKLSPFLDEEGILRLTGRMPEEVDINYDSKFPIILDGKHKYTQLLIQSYHEKCFHVGFETVVNKLRAKYWILNLRSTVRKIFYNCQACKIRKCQPNPPFMGNLPKERLEAFVYPFTFVGIDVFGPMTISIGRRIEKRYGVLFTCLSIRAIHIEIVASLGSSSTICAIRRFMSRRGQPREIVTDNGTNFVGACKELKSWRESLQAEEIQHFVSDKGIKWKFNPPLAPHMSGIWERMIRTVKDALKIILKTQNPTEEVLTTLLVEVEHIVNSRPLTHISVDPVEPEAITPNHFLLLRPSGVTSYGIDGTCSRKKWKFAQTLADSFWRRWVREYRPTLTRRSKWYEKSDPVKVGDVVVIVDEKLPRNRWLLGKIEKVFPGQDGQIRVSEVRTNRGTYTRPVTKLCVLPVTKT